MNINPINYQRAGAGTEIGCGKTPIREALVTLCNEESSAASRRLPGCHVREEAQNILDFRLVLEGGYLRQLIGHITEENLAELAEIDEDANRAPTAYGITGRQIQHSI